MGALRQPHLAESLKKPPVPETRKLDRYGRDPLSAAEVLRDQTGFSPLFHSMLADLPRLVEGSAAGWALVMTILRLSLGRPHEKERYPATLPISTADLAELCRCNVKTIQRQLDEMNQRGMIGCKSIKQGGGFVKYVLSLRLDDWRKLDDYPVWQRKQVVEMPSEGDTEADEDESPAAISNEAVRLTKGRETVRPGKSSKPKKVNVGVNSFQFRSTDSGLDLAHETVIQSGCLIVSVSSLKGESEAKGEDKAIAERHACRALPPNEGIGKGRSKGEVHPRATEICKIFDPLLQRSGARLLSPDPVSTQLACEALGEVDHEFLTYFILGPKGRAARPISGPRAVAAILRECRENWDKQRSASVEVESQVARCACGEPVNYVQEGTCFACHERLRDANS